MCPHVVNRCLETFGDPSGRENAQEATDPNHIHECVYGIEDVANEGQTSKCHRQTAVRIALQSRNVELSKRLILRCSMQGVLVIQISTSRKVESIAATSPANAVSDLPHLRSSLGSPHGKGSLKGDPLRHLSRYPGPSPAPSQANVCLDTAAAWCPACRNH